LYIFDLENFASTWAFPGTPGSPPHGPAGDAGRRDQLRGSTLLFLSVHEGSWSPLKGHRGTAWVLPLIVLGVQVRGQHVERFVPMDLDHGNVGLRALQVKVEHTVLHDPRPDLSIPVLVQDVLVTLGGWVASFLVP
jgi:hypothetical protein